MSSQITRINCTDAPSAAATYSHAVKANGFVYVSGQVPYTSDNKPITGTITEQAEQVILNIKNILNSAGTSLDKIIKVNVFLSDINYFNEFNLVYAKYFTNTKPARSCVAVAALPLNAQLEMEVIALE